MPRIGAAVRTAAQALPPRATARSAAAVFTAIAIGVPLILNSSFQLGRLELVLVYLLGAISLNFAYGYGGQLALGQPVMIATGAYAAGILSNHFDWDFYQTLPFAVVAAIAVSMLLGLPSLRVRGWYLAIIAFFAVGIFPDLVGAFPSLTGGTDGLTGILPIRLGGTAASGWVVYELMLAAAILSMLAVRNITSSGWGTALRTTRHHPIAAAASGIDLARMRAWVYVLAGIPCGLAGDLFAHSQQFLSSDDFGSNTILLIIGSVFLGGPGTLWGPVVGVAVFEGLSLYLGTFSPYNPLVLGCGVLLSALLFRGGIIRRVANLWARLASGKTPTIRISVAGGEDRYRLSPVTVKPSLSATGVKKHFAGNVVLAGVNLAVEGGRVLAVVGPNGSGKTTMLNTISGFVTPDEGSITINGNSIGGRPTHHRVRYGIGRTFQVPKLVEGFSILRNVELGAVGSRRPSLLAALFRPPGFRGGERTRRQAAMAACEAVGFSESESETPVSVLPLGLKRIVEIARVLAGDAQVICLDEPVAGLDDDERAQVSEILRALADSGRAVLVVEHNLPFVLSLCDDVVLLMDGRVADAGPPSVTSDRSRPLGQYFQTFVTEIDVAQQQSVDALTQQPGLAGEEPGEENVPGKATVLP
jgi:branched-chain amino acid transport system permease protein